MHIASKTISTAFLWRRVHSLMGLWLVLYLAEHLLVNSQAALWLGESGEGFIRMVNSLESLPYLHFVETLFIGVPVVLHGAWGIHRLFTSKKNLYSKGDHPSLPYGRNHAYTWQRWTSWILLFGIVGHVVQMRWVEQPRKELVNGQEVYAVEVKLDPGLSPLAQRLEATIAPMGKERAIVTANNPGTAMLIMVRDTFQSLTLSILYTVFLLAAVFHACNGLWTFLITWGGLLSYRSQQGALRFSWVGMGLLSFLGLAAIWGSYWL